jgi:Na+-translocating ferredoxin:NAD+ oxidoreductase RnfC subunit
MSHAQRLVVAVTTAADGSATAYTEGPVTGKVSQIRYVKTDYANGVDFTITSEATGETIWTESDVNASATRAPRQATHSTAGVASLYAATFAVNDKIALANDRIKIIIGSGGDTKLGTFHFVIE